MNNIVDLLADLQDADIRLTIEDNALTYDAPQGKLTQELRMKIANNKEEIISFLYKTQSKKLPELVSASTDEERYPLSLNQEQLWFYYKLNPSSSVYNIPAAIKITGKLNIQFLQESLEILISRHSILRTYFSLLDGKPTQKILKFCENPLKIKKVCHSNESNLDNELAILLKAEAKTPFPLEITPPFRPILWVSDEENYILQLTLHHLISDGWSTTLLIEELFQIYAKLISGTKIIDSETKFQYSDYTLWQHKILREGFLIPQISYWKNIFSMPSPPILNLPFDRQRPLTPSYCGRVEKISIKTETVNLLTNISRSENVSLFVIFMTALQTLLYKYTGQQDNVIGFLHSNRGAETKNLLGYFVNTLPLRSNIDPAKNFISLLATAKSVFLDAINNGVLPFNKIIEAIELHRELNYNPLFQVLIAQDNYPKTWNILNLKLNYFSADEEKSKFDIAFFITEKTETVDITCEYNTDLFNQNTIQGMLGHFQIILDTIAANPTININKISLLTTSEKNKIKSWNSTFVRNFLNKSLPQLIEQQVTKTPHNTAILFANDSLSYQELNDRSNQLAHYLCNLGARSEKILGIYMERSVEMIVAILAIIKSGAAYLPLEPEYPAERIAYLLKDANIELVLTTTCLKDKLSFYSGKVVCEFDDKNWIEQFPKSNLRIDYLLESLAYVIYTSGSTGKPKGVMNTHQGISNRLLWMKDTLNITEKDHILQKTPFSFDVSVWEIFLPIISGACLIVAKPQGHKDTNYIIETIEKYKITIIHFVPSMLDIFLDNTSIKKCNQYLKKVICSGEALTKKLEKTFFDRVDDAELYNFYGPTEAAIDVTFSKCSKSNSYNTVPIGKPIANTQIYILDEYLLQVPIGVVGEIYIGGVNLARGYLGKENLTNKYFVSNPFDPKSKLYRTGDLARYLYNGNIEYVGRTDFQVKMRGFRIELQEIESVICNFHNIKNCVVSLKKNKLENGILIAYITLNADINLIELQGYLKSVLPDYMIPAKFVTLDEMPLSSNGKIDRNSLPNPSDDRPDVFSDFIEPSTEVEKKIAKIWCSVLEIKRVGIHDRFFDLGGDSIKSLRVLYLLHEDGLKLDLQDLFRYQTIYNIANKIKPIVPSDNITKPKSFSLLTLRDKQKVSSDLEDAYPVSQLQLGLIYHSVYSSNYAVYTTSYLIKAPFNHFFLQRAINMIVVNHPMLRTAFNLADYSEPLQLVYRSPTPILEISNICHLSDVEQTETLSMWLQIERTKKFDWDKPPLFRFYVHLRSTNTFQFTIVEPILDGWSVALLATEVLLHYHHLLLGKEPNVNYKGISLYQTYIVLEKEALSSNEYKKFWGDKLINSPVTLLSKWPKESPQNNFTRIAIPVSKKQNLKLKELALSLGVPLKTVLLAVHIRTISILNGTREIVTGLMTNGRPENEFGESIIGLFLNVIPLRFNLSMCNWEELIREVFKAELETMPYRRYPLAQIQSDHGKTLFDTVFNYIHFYPYKDFQHGEVEILDIQATDQTYFFLTAQFSLDWRDLEIRLNLDFNLNDISPEQMKSIANYYSHNINHLVNSIEQPFSILNALSIEDYRKIFLEWNNTDRSSQKMISFSQLFEEQTDKTPHRIAVIDAQSQLTYQKLNSKANQIAHALIKKGIKHGEIVTILAPRSCEFLVCILALFKIGAAYLPVHPTWIPYRINQILKQSRGRWVIATSNFIQQIKQFLEETNQLNVISVIEYSDSLYQNELDMNLSQNLSNDDLAYVIYTSGSTGIPKGAMIQHSGMINHIYAKIEDFKLDHDSIIAQTASQCFDISVWQFLAALLVGGCIAIADDGVIKDPLILSRFIAANRVTIFETVPSLLKLIIENILNKQIMPTNFDTLDWLLVTGEAFPADLCNQWLTLFPKIPIANAYGPTECSDDVTHFIANALLPKYFNMVPIGKPIRNTKIYILNANLETTPIGVPGEIYVAGVGVGLGYLNDTVQTNKSFIYSTLNENAPVRLYKTGDLGHFLPDGNIEFLGRIDHQIKLRGFRIEVEEIEIVLRQHPLVNDAIITVQKINDMETLVAYVVLKAEINNKELKHFLQQLLPEYMVPQLFVYLEQFPLNQNGKTDRQSLPIPAQEKLKVGVPATTPLEIELANIWCQVLGINEISMEDNFFDLGGQSLQAIQLVSKMSRFLDREISIKFLMSCPTIEQIIDSLNKIRPLNFSPHSNDQFRLDSKKEPTLLPFLEFTEHSILGLFNTGKLQPVEAAAIGYLPDSLIQNATMNRDDIIGRWFDGFPIVRRIFTTNFGRICHITLPMFGSDLYHEPEKLLDSLLDALEIAKTFGARTVSLTGLIPSATDYGLSIAAKISHRKDLPKITTGHAATVSAVILSLENILTMTNRALQNEHVGFLGLGSIGLSSLELMLKILPHPAEITLCDIYNKTNLLSTIKSEIIRKFSFQGRVNTMASSGKEVPTDFYQSTLIVGATNTANILAVELLKPGVIIVDDSAPHCFDPDLAITRFEQNKDILFTEGGVLRSNRHPISELRYLPKSNNHNNPFKIITNYRNSEYEIMGCLFSSLLPSIFPDIKPSLGLIDIDVTSQHYQKLKELDFGAAALCCKDYLLSIEKVRRFCSKE